MVLGARVESGGGSLEHDLAASASARLGSALRGFALARSIAFLSARLTRVGSDLPPVAPGRTNWSLCVRLIYAVSAIVAKLENLYCFSAVFPRYIAAIRSRVRRLSPIAYCAAQRGHGVVFVLMYRPSLPTTRRLTLSFESSRCCGNFSGRIRLNHRSISCIRRRSASCHQLFLQPYALWLSSRAVHQKRSSCCGKTFFRPT